MRRNYNGWNANENQLPCVLFPLVQLQDCGNLRFVFSCFGHVVNIANVAVMSCVTQIAAIENATAIWEYDPSLPGNRILGGSLDVIAAIRTIAVKVSVFLHHYLHFLRCSQIQASGQRIEYFERLQLQCKFLKPLRIPLHSNVRWGSAHGMLERSYKLRQVSNHPGLIVFLH